MFKTKLILAIIFTQAIFLALPMTGCAPAEYDIETEANPEETGEITGTGTYEENEEVTLKAEPEDGYEFDYWELEGEEVNTEEIYTLNAEEDYRFTVHFSEAKYEIKAGVDPEEAGKVSGEGTFEKGEEVTLEASPEKGYEFSARNENGEKISSSGEYTFKVESDKNLVAVFGELDFEIKEGKDEEAFEKKVELHINIEQGSPWGDYILSKHAVGLDSYVYAIYDMEKWDHEEEEFLDNAKKICHLK